MERVAQVVQALATAVRAGRSLSPDEARAALCEVERLIDLLEIRHGADAPALASALRNLHAALGARGEQTAVPGPDVAARAAGRRFRATLGRVVAVLAAGAALSAPMAVAAQERVYTGPLPGGVSTGAATGERIVVRDVDGPITPGAGSSGLRMAGDGGTGGDGSNSSLTNTDDGGAGGNGGGGASFEVAIDLQGSSIAARDAAGVLLTARGGAAGEGGYDDAVLSAVGGRGGAGGTGGSINGGFSGDVTVDGAYGPAIRVDLNGGDGGSGGEAEAIAARGGVGGAGGNGGSGVFNLAGDLVTRGLGSVGIFATADGGAGGGAGDSDGVGSTDDSDGFGRAGGQGGRGGLLDIDFDGSIQTDGTFASGLAALSRGGQGGRGGSAGSVNAAGGRGGNGGDGGAVRLQADGAIQTSGDDAGGVVAVSAGGQGGRGGDADSPGDTPGGDGGAGGRGGAVAIVNRAAIQTGGERAGGLFASSVGGGGGQGGAATAIYGAYGGGGGASADGGAATIENFGDVATGGGYAAAVMAQSIGGFGGGGASSLGFFGGAYGGDGRNAGAGGAVRVDNAGDLTTDGYQSYGLWAGSVGGGGGVAGGGLGLVSHGGTGGGGGDGGSVIASNTGQIQTRGDTATAMLVQSVGGGGGSGGLALGAVLTMGGTGGDGGDGGDVAARLAGGLHTEGAEAHGLFAQSVGGGGGSGGAAGSLSLNLAMAFGGQGQGGGDGGAVSVNAGLAADAPGAMIRTEGDRSVGLFAQSVGGGGGSGGLGAALSAGYIGSISASLGGSAGTGGSGGDVDVAFNGGVETSGDFAAGLFAQSVGGGGGNGGLSIAAAGSDQVALSGAIGGRGGRASSGGDVEVRTRADLVTHGRNAAALQAQSVGGGGGSGGFAVSGAASSLTSATLALGGEAGPGGDGGLVRVDHFGDLTTTGDLSYGLLAQSVGGGGGSGGFTASASFVSGPLTANLGMSGSGGGAGHGGAVEVGFDGAATTAGAGAHALIVQSVGGGGGAGGLTAGVAVSLAGAAVNARLGGTGGAGGDGGTVTFDGRGALVTTGELATGALIQSVGGGGGSGGLALALTGTGGRPNISASLGGSGGVAGSGGTVTARFEGSIETSGASANALLAQSVGGGGGQGGSALSLQGGGGGSFNLNANAGGSGGIGAVGGAVDLTSRGLFVTGGDLASAIVAQSLGGGGGSGGAALQLTGGGNWQIDANVGGFGGSGNSGGDVVLDHSGAVQTRGIRAYGVLAQSVGGGGGAGGAALRGTGTSAYPSFGFTVGGFGADGSIGGAVSLTSAGSVWTEGDGSHAVLAQSVGGGGGQGGLAGSLSVNVQGGGSLNVTVGGGGGAGAHGGAIDLATRPVAGTDFIRTRGVGAFGVAAQSVGGSGGEGGFSMALNGGRSSTALSVSLAVGGAGGDGAYGGAVDLDNQINVLTDGDWSYGLFAQSIGGSGGAGGSAAAFDIQTGDRSINLTGSVGGIGGDGAYGGDIRLANTGQIRTEGDNAVGVYAQSTGGGGGAGGWSFAGSLSAQGGKAFKVALGGDGGTGGFGGDVLLDNDGSVHTDGLMATALMAQSVGGGGGVGGFSAGAGINAATASSAISMQLIMGGAGGSGNHGGDVRLDNTAALSTFGVSSTAMIAQSIGGGGGIGGGALGVLLTGNGARANSGVGVLSVNVTMGGNGGTGGDGGEVEARNSGAIWTRAADSHGLFAQSLGGGGGMGGASNNINMIIGEGCGLPLVCKGSPNAGNSSALSASVGGKGGVAGDGGAVTVANSGDLLLERENSLGITAQSIGGGGGFGGNGVIGLGGLVPSAVDLAVTIGGAVPDYSTFWVTANVAVGGQGGASGEGGAISVDNRGDIATLGGYAEAIFAQSVGGGGGRGGVGATGATGRVGVGGRGGASGDGGVVEVANDGVLSTKGVGSTGIFAQSVGGGGGIGGNINRAMAEPLSDDPRLGFYNFGIAVPIGGAGGAGGDGGAVTVTNTGSVLTEGEGAVGIFAQSVGGGGGVRGRVGIQTPVTPDIFDSLANWIGSMGGAGDAGAVRVTTGEVVTRGAYADAVFAQSTGGTGVGGDVHVSVDGDVMAFGEGAHGVRVQSAGIAGDGDILVEVARGARVFGGAGTMASAVWFMDGEAADGRNSLRNDGVIAASEGVAGYAVRGSTAEDSVLNRGLISGNIDLGDGVNRLINEVDGVLWSGLVLRLGAGNTLHNAGLVSIRGDDVGPTVITGDYAQSADGRLLFQHDALTSIGDTLRVVGTAALQGTVVADVANLDQLATGRHATDLISADQLSLSGISLIAPQSLVVQFSLEDVHHSQGDRLRLVYDIDYSPDLPGLSGNRAALGDYIGRIQDAGGTPAFRPIANLILQVVDPEQLKALYDNLSPQLNTASTSADFGSHARFSDSLFSCSPMSGAARVEAADGRCVWGRGGRREVERDADASASGYDSAIDTFALGVEAPVGAGLRAGVALGAEREKVTLADHTGTGDIRRSQLGAVIKAPGRLADLAVFATVGWSETDLRRGVAIPTPSLARSEQAATAWGVGVRATGDWGDESGWIRPMAQVDGLAVDREAYVEQGGGPGALSVEGEREDYWRVRVGVETGAGLPFGDGMILRPTARIGVSHRLDTAHTAVNAGFVSAPMGTGLFETRIQEDETVLETGLGLEISSGRGGAVRFDYARRDGDITREQSFTAKLVVPF